MIANNNTAATITTSNINMDLASALETKQQLVQNIYEALERIDSAISVLSIADAERIMDSLKDLECCIVDQISSRIPQNRLSLVEGRWYIIATADEDSDADTLTERYMDILAESPLYAVEGYAEQLLAEAREEEQRLTECAAEFAKDLGEYRDEILVEVEPLRKALEDTLSHIKQCIAEHGRKITPGDSGLDLAILEPLVAFNMAE